MGQLKRIVREGNGGALSKELKDQPNIDLLAISSDAANLASNLMTATDNLDVLCKDYEVRQDWMMKELQRLREEKMEAAKQLEEDSQAELKKLDKEVKRLEDLKKHREELEGKCVVLATE